jgi:DNA recombination protein RmuC
MNENAKAAAEDSAMTLYTRIGKVLEHMEKLGKSLNGSVEAFNKMVGSVDKRVDAEPARFEELPDCTARRQCPG